MPQFFASSRWMARVAATRFALALGALGCGSGPWGAALLVSILVMGCADDDNANDNDNANENDNEGRTGPMCLLPPWVPRDGDVAGQSVACASEREFGLVLPGTTPVTEDLSLQFLEQNRAAIHAFEGVELSGYWLCCEGTWRASRSTASRSACACAPRLRPTCSMNSTALQGSAAATSGIGFQILGRADRPIGRALRIGRVRRAALR